MFILMVHIQVWGWVSVKGFKWMNLSNVWKEKGLLRLPSAKKKKNAECVFTVRLVQNWKHNGYKSEFCSCLGPDFQKRQTHSHWTWLSIRWTSGSVLQSCCVVDGLLSFYFPDWEIVLNRSYLSWENIDLKFKWLPINTLQCVSLEITFWSHYKGRTQMLCFKRAPSPFKVSSLCT